ncbi:MAG: circularly permuted type 2 ATP-grasp protein [Candidatus Omnitrophica bacterium]|nr:circularly permuted type 2 ATP-grasp protein [Candidatus Omnitrophota bacterium]
MRKTAIRKIDGYLRSLSAKETGALQRLFLREVERLNIRYLNDFGKPRNIALVLRPWLVEPGEAKLLHRLIYSFRNMHAKLFPLYFSHPGIRQALPLRRQEKEWFELINRKSLQKYQVVFGRWDTNACFDKESRVGDIMFLETNTVGIGGIHYIPVVSEALSSILKASLEHRIRPCCLGHQADPRLLLAEEIKRHARLINRKSLNVAFIENREFLAGTVELPELTKFFNNLGIKAILADPRDLKAKGQEIYYRDVRLDIIYRDSELQELIDIEKKGHGMQALKQAFINNQVISSIAGELDHKSVFEVFSSPEFYSLFNAKERQLLKRHVPWTRLLKERCTADESLRRIDLAPFVEKNKDKLIIKPNRAYGGKGVVIGKLTGKKVWRDYLEKALAKPGTYVVQRLVMIHQEEFPYFSDEEKITFDRFYGVSGFVVTAKSTAVLGRFSKEMVVNVARKGGIIPTLMLHH